MKHCCSHLPCNMGAYLSPPPSPPVWGYRWGRFPINTWIPLVLDSYLLLEKSKFFPKPPPVFVGILKGCCLCSRVRPPAICQLPCGSVSLCTHKGADPPIHSSHCCPCTQVGRRMFPSSVLTSLKDALEGCLRPTVLENWVKQLLWSYTSLYSPVASRKAILGMSCCFYNPYPLPAYRAYFWDFLQDSFLPHGNSLLATIYPCNAKPLDIPWVQSGFKMPHALQEPPQRLWISINKNRYQGYNMLPTSTKVGMEYHSG